MTQEKADIFKQLIANDQLEKIGALSDLSVSFLETEHLLQPELKTFEFNNHQCLALPLICINERIGTLFLTRDILSFFNSNEIGFLQKYSEVLRSILRSSLWMAEKENTLPSTHLTQSERLTYLKTADLDIRDKRRISLYLHDDILQRILGLKNNETIIN